LAGNVFYFAHAPVVLIIRGTRADVLL